MLKGLTGITNGILIYTDPNDSGKAEISFIFKINPSQNLAMMSEQDLIAGVESMRRFLSINTYIFSIIKKKVGITDYDYLPNYEAIVKQKDLKGKDNALHKNMLQGTARMIQEYSAGTMKHEYFLKVSVFITNTTNDKEIIKKYKELQDIVQQFPVQYRVEKMLGSKEVLIFLLKENRFFTSELNSLIKKDIKKGGFYKDILTI